MRRTSTLGKQITFGLAVFMIAVIIFVNQKGDEHNRNVGRKEAQEQYRDSLRIEKQHLQEKNDSLTLLIDSIRVDRKNDSTKLVTLTEEMKKIKGRYNNVANDSLGQLMNGRRFRKTR